MNKNNSGLLNILGILLLILCTFILIIGIILTTGPASIKPWGAAAIVFSGAGFIASIAMMIKAGMANMHKPDPTGEPLGTILEEDKALVEVRALSVPEGVHLVSESDKLVLTWKRLVKNEYFSLVVGLIFLFLSLIWFLFSKDTVYAIIYLVGGIFLTYFFLVIAVNKHTIKVTRQQLSSKYIPLPLARGRLLNCAEIIQLITVEETANTKYGRSYFYALMAVTEDGKLVRLVSGKAYETIHYFELVIEDWLGIKDVRVAGEVRR